MQKRYLLLKTGPAAFRLSLDLEDKAITLCWVAKTEVPKLVWTRLITIKWRWPPVRCVTAFTDVD